MNVKEKKKDGRGRPRTSVSKVEAFLDADADADLKFLRAKLPNMNKSEVIRRALARLRWDYEK